MENDKQNNWSYSYNFTQPIIKNWVESLDTVTCEMILMDMMCCDLEKKDCDEARGMLENIGIKC
jgi:hypothetical protein